MTFLTVNVMSDLGKKTIPRSYILTCKVRRKKILKKKTNKNNTKINKNNSIFWYLKHAVK